MVGSILNECLTRKITGLAFLTPALMFMLDAEAAAVLIGTPDSVYDFRIGTQGLVKKAEQLKQKLKEFAERHERLKKAEEGAQYLS